MNRKYYSSLYNKLECGILENDLISIPIKDDVKITASSMNCLTGSLDDEKSIINDCDFYRKAYFTIALIKLFKFLQIN